MFVEDYTTQRCVSVLNNVSTGVDAAGDGTRGNWCFARCLLFMVCPQTTTSVRSPLCCVVCVCKCVTGAIRMLAEMSLVRGKSQRNRAFVVAHSAWLGEMSAWCVCVCVYKVWELRRDLSPPISPPFARKCAEYLELRHHMSQQSFLSRSYTIYLCTGVLLNSPFVVLRGKDAFKFMTARRRFAKRRLIGCLRKLTLTFTPSEHARTHSLDLRQAWRCRLNTQDSRVAPVAERRKRRSPSL